MLFRHDDIRRSRHRRRGRVRMGHARCSFDYSPSSSRWRERYDDAANQSAIMANHADRVIARQSGRRRCSGVAVDLLAPLLMNAVGGNARPSSSSGGLVRRLDGYWPSPAAAITHRWYGKDYRPVGAVLCSCRCRRNTVAILQARRCISPLP